MALQTRVLRGASIVFRAPSLHGGQRTVSRGVAVRPAQARDTATGLPVSEVVARSSNQTPVRSPRNWTEVHRRCFPDPPRKCAVKPKKRSRNEKCAVRRNPLLVHIWAVDRAGVEGIDTADGKQSSLQSQLQLRNPE